LSAVVARARGKRFSSVNLAVAHADRPPADLIAELRDLADSRRKPAITTLDNLLFDTLVHVQDIAVPLGLTATMPLEAAREGAERVWRMSWPFWARRRLRGLRLFPGSGGHPQERSSPRGCGKATSSSDPDGQLHPRR
jgi:hypothetical protein